MTTSAPTARTREQDYPRILGSYETARPGPCFVLTSGIHGNEPAGAEAALRVCEGLLRKAPPLRGRFLALAGNLPALQQGERYLDADLNRLWTPESVVALRAQPRERDHREHREQRELIGIFDDCLLTESEEVVVLDLHSSSADGSPFTCMADTIANRRIALALPLPVILGLEETIDGAMLDYVYQLGHVGVAVEGGRHDDPATVENLEAAIWIALVAAGCLREPEVPEYGAYRRRLERSARGIPRVIEIRHREILEPGDSFVMKPGYDNFDRVEKEELLATKNGVELFAAEDGFILLPLYQGRGSDGYFLGRAVRPAWLKLSAFLRRIGLARVLPILPGVRRHPSDPDAFMVDPRFAALKAVEVFHLLGFRRQRREGDRLVFIRRREGRRHPRVG